MRLLAISQQVLTGRGARLFASALSVLVLAAVPALGITRLGTDALSSWGLRGPDQVAGLSAGPLTFEAPTTVLAGFQAAEEGHRALAQADQEPVTELAEWIFTLTANDLLAVIAFTAAFDFQGITGQLNSGLPFDQVAQFDASPLAIQIFNLANATRTFNPGVAAQLDQALSLILNAAFTGVDIKQIFVFEVQVIFNFADLAARGGLGIVATPTPPFQFPFPPATTG